MLLTEGDGQFEPGQHKSETGRTTWRVDATVNSTQRMTDLQLKESRHRLIEAGIEPTTACV